MPENDKHFLLTKAAEAIRYYEIGTQIQVIIENS